MKGYFNSVAEKIRLRFAKQEEFLLTMMEEFTSDKTTERMEEAIKVMQKRFPQVSKTAELTRALSVASWKGNIAMMDYLIGEGALPGGDANYSAFPLRSAMLGGKLEAVEHLIAKGAKSVAGGPDYLDLAAHQMPLITSHRNYPEMTRALVRGKITDGIEEVLDSVLGTHHDYLMADILIKDGGASVNALGGSIVRDALRYAVRQPDPEGEKILQFVSDRGADFNAAVDNLKKDKYSDGILKLAKAMKDNQQNRMKRAVRSFNL